MVSAPASSANLGPGFDCMALALELRNEVEITRGQGDASVEVSGEGAGELVGDADNLFLRAFRAGGGDPQGLRFRMRNAVPFARGLGSSAAAIVAGLVAADAWNGRGERDLLSQASELEGHTRQRRRRPQRRADAGLERCRRRRRDRVRHARGRVRGDYPRAAPVTAEARSALPETVPRDDAVHTASRAALLVAAVGAGDGELLRDALDDRLHEPYRAPLVPLLGRIRGLVGDDQRVYGVTLSGAGPSVLVWCVPAGPTRWRHRWESFPALRRCGSTWPKRGAEVRRSAGDGAAAHPASHEVAGQRRQQAVGASRPSTPPRRGGRIRRAGPRPPHAATTKPPARPTRPQAELLDQPHRPAWLGSTRSSSSRRERPRKWVTMAPTCGGPGDQAGDPTPAPSSCRPRREHGSGRMRRECAPRRSGKLDLPGGRAAAGPVLQLRQREAAGPDEMVAGIERRHPAELPGQVLDRSLHRRSPGRSASSARITASTPRA